MTGRIVSVDHARQRGVVRDEDGRERSFEREGMILWLQFDTLRPGAQVRYDVESASGRAINVALSPP